MSEDREEGTFGLVRVRILRGNVKHNSKSKKLLWWLKQNSFSSALSFLSFPSSFTTPRPLPCCCLSFTPVTFFTLSWEWQTPWSRCAAQSWGPWPGMPSLNVNSSYRGSPPSWAPAPGSRAEAPEQTGPVSLLLLQGLGLDLQDREAKESGNPRVTALCWGKSDTVLGVDLQPEPGRTQV